MFEGLQRFGRERAEQSDTSSSRSKVGEEGGVVRTNPGCLMSFDGDILLRLVDSNRQ